jgi:hypothetical protein
MRCGSSDCGNFLSQDFAPTGAAQPDPWLVCWLPVVMLLVVDNVTFIGGWTKAEISDNTNPGVSS